MAMNEKMRVSNGIAVQRGTEGQHLLNVAGTRCNRSGGFVDHIVKAKLQFPVRAEMAEHPGDRPFRVKNGQHVADPGFAVDGELIQPADGKAKWQFHGCTGDWRETRQENRNTAAATTQVQ